MIIDKICEYLDGQGQEIDASILGEVSILAARAFERQFGARKEDSPALRLSSIGRCVRQQAYNLLGFPKNGKEIDARAKMVFFQGDLAEMAIISLIKATGLTVGHTGEEQVIIDIDGVQGHPDGIFTNETGDFLLEVKSMSSFSFADFQRGNLEEGYLYQINAYMEALSLDKAVVIALNKDAGVLHEQVIKKSQVIIQEIKDRIQIIRAATRENLPFRPFTPDSKGFWPWNCLYCAYRGTCLPEAELVLDKNKYRLKERVTT